MIFVARTIERIQFLNCCLPTHPHTVDQVDAQLQQLRTTQTYLYWRERSHRKTIESTNRRVLWYAILRASTLVAASVAQVMGVRYMFSKK